MFTHALFIIVAAMGFAGCGENEQTFAGRTGAATPADKAKEGDAVAISTTDQGAAEASPIIDDAQVHSQKFTVTGVERVETTLEIKDNSQSHTQKMNEIIASDVVTKQQISRDLQTEMFVQGFNGTSMTDNFMQSSAKGLVDILIVVDDSGSMDKEQKDLSTKLEPLLEYVKEADWRIGVITTDPSKACMRRVINKGDANAVANFKDAIQAGIGGTGAERGFITAEMALKCTTPTWVRNGSSLAVLFVSDEDAAGHPNENPPAADRDPARLKAYITDTLKRTIGTNAKFYGLVNPDNEACSTAYSDAPDYNKLINDSKGVVGSICAADYSAPLQAISQNVADILDKAVSLSSVPDKNTLKIYVDDVLWNGAYSLSGKVLTFDNNALPPSGSKIRVTYKTPSQPVIKTWGLAHVADKATVEVKVEGQLQAATLYTVDSVNKKITFKAAPAEKSNIMVEYLKDQPLPKSWNIGADRRNLTVKVAGTALPAAGFNYNKATGVVALAAAPKDGEMVRFDFDKLTGKMLSYKGPYPELTAAVGCFKPNMQEIPCRYDNKTVTFKEADFMANQIVTIRYRSSMKNDASWTLEGIPASEVVSDAPEDLCEILTKDESVKVSCSNATDLQLKLAYDKLVSVDRQFLMAQVQDPAVRTWTVTVDGVTTDEWSREGSTITIDAAALSGKPSYEVSIEAQLID